MSFNGYLFLPGAGPNPRSRTAFGRWVPFNRKQLLKAIFVFLDHAMYEKGKPVFWGESSSIWVSLLVLYYLIQIRYFGDGNTTDVTWCLSPVYHFQKHVETGFLIFGDIKVDPLWMSANFFAMNKVTVSLCSSFANTWRLCKCTFAHQPFITRFNISWFIAAFYCFSNFIIPSPFISWQDDVGKSFLISLIYLFIPSFTYTSTNPQILIKLIGRRSNFDAQIGPDSTRGSLL